MKELLRELSPEDWMKLPLKERAARLLEASEKLWEGDARLWPAVDTRLKTTIMELRARELKPCPFCGGAAIMEKSGPITLGHGESTDTVSIRCRNDDCFAQVNAAHYADYEVLARQELVVARWNRRAAPEHAAPQDLDAARPKPVNAELEPAGAAPASVSPQAPTAQVSSGDSQQSLRQGGTAAGADWVRRLIELEAKACESPWRIDPDDRPRMKWNNHILYGKSNAVCFMAHSGVYDNSKHEAAAKLIVALRNAWPQIKAALSAAPRPDAGEPSEAMLLAAKDCTPVTENAPDFRVTARSIYVCMEAARALSRPDAGERKKT